MYSHIQNFVPTNTAWLTFVLLLWISFLSLISTVINIFYNVYHQTLKVDDNKNQSILMPFILTIVLLYDECLAFSPKTLLTFFYCWHSFDVCMIAKTTVLFICVHIQDKSTVFTVSMKMPTIGFSDFNTLLLFPGLRLVLWVHVAVCSLYKRPLDERGKTQLNFKKKIVFNYQLCTSSKMLRMQILSPNDLHDCLGFVFFVGRYHASVIGCAIYSAILRWGDFRTVGTYVLIGQTSEKYLIISQLILSLQ